MGKTKMQSAPPRDLEFEIVYSIHLEKLSWTLLGRVDRFLALLQLALGAAIINSFAPTVSGILVVLIGAAQFVWQPGIKASEAKASHDRWLDLYLRHRDISADVIAEEIRKISEKDTQVIDTLALPACWRTAVQLNRNLDNLAKIPFWQKTIAFFSGGLPVVAKTTRSL